MQSVSTTKSVGASLLAMADELSPHIHILPAKVGKPVFATDNAQFFHQRMMRRRTCGRKRRP
jgi:hypothetical protein